MAIKLFRRCAGLGQADAAMRPHLEYPGTSGTHRSPILASVCSLGFLTMVATAAWMVIGPVAGQQIWH